ncbi:MAG: hypothetical protein JNK85_00875 [Verrucomicrobiales bacterium]|nr:hypothetical protein [Verrucomicrobiales bacterium]
MGLSNKLSMSIVVLSLFCSHNTRAMDGDAFMSCRVDGATNTFIANAQALYLPMRGLHIMAFTGDRSRMASLALLIPTPKLGVSRLSTVTNITLFFSHSVLASSWSNYYDAGSQFDGTELEVTLLKFGGIGERVEGRFSGLAVNHLGEQIRITDGRFSVLRRQPSVNEPDTAITQPQKTWDAESIQQEDASIPGGSAQYFLQGTNLLYLRAPL